MTKPELSTSPEDVDDSFFVDCVVSQTGQRYILVTQGDTKVFLRRSLFVGPMQKALSALAEGGIELVSLAHLIHRVAEKPYYTPTFQWIRPIWPVAKNATAENVEPTDRPGFSIVPASL
jgi:hypothetical protein